MRRQYINDKGEHVLEVKGYWGDYVKELKILKNKLRTDFVNENLTGFNVLYNCKVYRVGGFLGDYKTMILKEVGEDTSGELLYVDRDELEVIRPPKRPDSELERSRERIKEEVSTIE